MKYDNICQKRCGSWKEKNGQNPFQAFLRLKKKVVWTTKPLGWEVKP